MTRVLVQEPVDSLKHFGHLGTGSIIRQAAPASGGSSRRCHEIDSTASAADWGLGALYFRRYCQRQCNLAHL